MDLTCKPVPSEFGYLGLVYRETRCRTSGDFPFVGLDGREELAHESIEGMVGLDHPGGGLGGRVFGL